MKDKSGGFLTFFTNLGDPHVAIDMDLASAFVCRMYAQSKFTDIDEARHNKLLRLTGKVNQENPHINVKRVDCALLPPCRRTLEMKVKRSQHVTILWLQATSPHPGNGLSPMDYGWAENNGLLVPVWFKGSATPETFIAIEENSHSDETIIVEEEDAEDRITKNP